MGVTYVVSRGRGLLKSKQFIVAVCAAAAMLLGVMSMESGAYNSLQRYHGNDPADTSVPITGQLDAGSAVISAAPDTSGTSGTTPPKAAAAKTGASPSSRNAPGPTPSDGSVAPVGSGTGSDAPALSLPAAIKNAAEPAPDQKSVLSLLQSSPLQTLGGTSIQLKLP